nr:FecR family protein [Chitinophaga sp. Cy-1792]
MSTPKGRKFRLQLPDGTHVWINAASSLRFPTAFTKGDRTVELSGEAYFEVAPLPKQPFKVKLDDGTFIQVLGTDFNVNAYKEEHLISTTLLRGAVKISRKNIQQVLKPGQQMQLVQDSEAFTIVNKVDTSAVMAWKNGFLSFQDKKLTEVMHMLERWYGIEVIYQGIPPDIVFYGEIGSDVNLSGVLKFLEDSGVKFSMEKNQLTVAAKQ